MNALIPILGAYAFVVLCWVLYLAIMHLAKYRYALGPVAKFHAYFIILPVGYLCDAALNLLVCAAFLRIPRDWLLTGTLKRLINTEDNWRANAASWICTQLLDQFDPKGRHC